MVRQIAHRVVLFRACHILAQCSVKLPHLETLLVKSLRRVASARQLCLYVYLSPEIPDSPPENLARLRDSQLRRLGIARPLFPSFSLSQLAPFPVRAKPPAILKHSLLLPLRRFRRLLAAGSSSNRALWFFPFVVPVHCPPP